MIVGVPKEIKSHENRVGLTTGSVAELVKHGHRVLIETNAGAAVSMTDLDYQAAGAEICDSADAVFDHADLIVKVKEPQLTECAKLSKGQILFTYLHLAADKPQADALCASGCTAIAYETITDAAGRLPLLQPMSEVAGRMSVQVGARYLEGSAGGPGLLLGGVPGVAAANVVILGGGIAGENALQMALGARANVTLFEKSLNRIAELDRVYGSRATISYSTSTAVEQAIADADLIIGAVLVPGAAAPKLIRREDLARLKSGCVLVDIAIDQGGCFETSRPTTHDDPVYVVDGIVHYCVANMPGGVARTSTIALNNATLPYVLKLADNGVRLCLDTDDHFARGLNVHEGRVCHPAVAEALGLPSTN